MRPRAMVVALALAFAGQAQAVGIRAMIKFYNEGIKAQPQAVVKMTATLQAKLLEIMVLDDFSHFSDGESLQVKFMGDAKPGSNANVVSQAIRQAATAAAEVLAGTKLAEYQVRVELDEANPDRKAMKAEHELELQHRERARPSPRLEIQVKDKLFTELTILDVPLVRALDQIGRQMPLSYVLHVQVVGQPIYVRLQDATLEEALEAIAESGNLKIVRQAKFLKFLPQDRPAR